MKSKPAKNISPYLQLLGEPMPGCAPSYRGTFRSGITYDDSKPEDHPFNAAFRQYADAGEQLRDLETARTLYETIRRYASIELVMISLPMQSHPLFTGLGYDVSIAGWYSLLGIIPSIDLATAQQLGDYCRSHLNPFGLLDSLTDALFVRDAARTLAATRNFFESADNIAVLEPVHISVFKGNVI